MKKTKRINILKMLTILCFVQAKNRNAQRGRNSNNNGCFTFVLIMKCHNIILGIAQKI